MCCQLVSEDSPEVDDVNTDAGGENADPFDADPDGIGSTADPNDDNNSVTDEAVLADGTDSSGRFFGISRCFSFDADQNFKAQPLVDGLLGIRYLVSLREDSKLLVLY